MSQGTSNQKSNASKRRPRQEKTVKDTKLVKENEKFKSSSIKKSLQNETHRSGSLSRQNPIKVQVSPRKSQSIDRSQSTRQKVNDGTPKKIFQRSSSKPDVDAVNKKGTSSNVRSINAKKELKSVTNTSTNQNHVPTIQKKKSSEKSSKGTDGKTNAQIAKSFIRNAQSRAEKPMKSSSDVEKLKLKKQNSSIPNHELESHNIERPRTSTIHKSSSQAVKSHSKINETKSASVSKDDNSVSGSKTSLKADSDDDDKVSYEEDFEEYDSDFEETDTESVSESDSMDSSLEEPEEVIQNSQSEEKGTKNSVNSVPIGDSAKLSDTLNIPIIDGRKNAEKKYLKMSDRSSLNSEKTVKDIPEKKPIKLSRSLINFESAIEKNETNNNDECLYDTSEELKKIDDISQKELIVPPITYNYLSVNNSNLKQVLVQTELCDEEEIQTDEIEIVNKWTQNPTNSTAGCGGDEIISTSNKASTWKSLFNVHSTKLSSFLQKSSNIILTLLDEEFATPIDYYKVKRRHGLFYSDGYYVLSPLNFLLDIPVVDIYCSESSPFIITIHGNMTELQLTDDMASEKGIICVWNVLDTNSQPTCGTFGPGFSDIVIAGMVDGAIMLWDLTEINANHFQISQDIHLTLCSPTYNTALILGEESHRSCIVGIQAVVNNSKEDWRSSGFTGSNKNFHVITLEDMGVINTWVVVEVLKPDASGVETDLGLAPGGKYRLVKSSCISLYNLTTILDSQKLSIRTFDFQLVPFDSSRMLVTTDAGITLHVTRHSGGIEPRFYSSETEFSPEVRCIDCSTLNEDLFLVGCNDGSIKLFNTKLVRPLMEFLHAAKGEPVNLLKWSIVHPSVFCVLSSSSCIHFWNIIENSINPLHSYQFEDCKVTWFAFRNVEHKPKHAFPDRLSNFIIAKENGEVEVHTFQTNITEHEYRMQLEFMKNL
ncbi:WD repeat-containing protein 60 [Nephila pilipes]|uniref:WD repeat-containing protein 60 n=1 Tax=Nephila pilipes TaxID=299642 RepID=A0A8X6QIF2_NEPPI|nr:WD repeat-containing protein 60 [Nephila pilipes]GFU28403.1 WD repeat-containing protein 60 [Nephila pilipes]